MKKLMLAAAAATLLAGCSQKTVFSSSWELQSSLGGKSYKVDVPCTVAGALLDKGEEVAPELFDTTWVFTKTFKAPDKGAHAILRFNSLNYAADISLNGETLAAADTTFGTFIVREFDITPLLGKENTLSVIVHKAPSKALNHGWVDWNPRPEDESMGITGPVDLILTHGAFFQNVFVRPEIDPEDLSKAAVEIVSTLVNLEDTALSGALHFEYEGDSFSIPVSLEGRQKKTISQRREIHNPRIWWSREMGKPELYHLKSFFESDGNSSNAVSVRFGLRSITSEIDSFGHRLYRLNGRPILLKGAGWTDDRYMRDSHQSISEQMAFVADMGLNCIRFENIWGKDDYVYDLCDSLGILALVGWSCQWEWDHYCGYPQIRRYGCINDSFTQDLVLRYFHDQVIRLRNHPAVIGWLTGSDMLPNPQLEKEYLRMYKELDYRPYQCSASGLVSELSGPSGAKMMGPYEYVGPDYWYLDTSHGGNYGFNTETSIGMNIPQLESLKRMLGEEHLWPIDKKWDSLCTSASEVFNTAGPALEAVTGHFGEPSSAEDFVWKAHALDYDGTRGMFEAFRCGVPQTTGIIQWMLNSACPSLYWQLYDWFLVPTAAYFGTKKACAPLQLIYNYKEKAVYGVNDAAKEGLYTARLRFFDKDSKEILRKESPVTLSPMTPVKVFDGISGPGFLSLSLIDGDGKEVSRNFYCLPEGENLYAWDKASWWGIPIDGYASFAFLNALPRENATLSLQESENGWRVTLSNHSQKVSYMNRLKALDQNGNLVPAVLWSDNFISLLPGETVTVECTLPGGVAPKDVHISLS